MKKLIWSDHLNTGIQVIDRQHRRIVDYINRLYESHKNGSSKEETGAVIDELVDYTLTHFAFEETMLEDVDYAELDAHKVFHDQFIQQVREIRERFEEHEIAAIELNNLMVTWLFNHILNEDAAYVSAVVSKK
jgi:hemerythrin